MTTPSLSRDFARPESHAWQRSCHGDVVRQGDWKRWKTAVSDDAAASHRLNTRTPAAGVRDELRPEKERSAAEKAPTPIRLVSALRRQQKRAAMQR